MKILYINNKTCLFLHRKQWYDCMANDENCNQMCTCSTSTEQQCINISFPRLHLIIDGFQDVGYDRLLENFIRSINASVKFTNLHIHLRYHFSISTIIYYLNLLSNLDSLTITYTFRELSKLLSNNQNDNFHSLPINNKITKVNLELITELDSVHALMDLFPQMRYLQVKCDNFVGVKSLILHILKKKNTKFLSYLYSICLWIKEADDYMINPLKKLIHTEKLVSNYTIKRICDKILFSMELNTE